MSAFISLILTIFIYFCAVGITKRVPHKNSLSPVILVPGDGGSQVEAKLNKTDVPHYICSKLTNDYFSIWLNLELLVPLVIDCWVDNLKLSYDINTRTTRNSPGVETRIPGFGDPFTVEWIDPTKASPGAYFKDIGDALVNLGYERNISLRGAPYDFRKAPNENTEFFVNLQNLIEETYKINNLAPVTLIAHSMGAPMCLHFLQSMSQRWKDTYIERLVTLAGAWGGSMKAVKVYAVGDDLGVYVLREKTLREMQITSPSLAWLLPSPLFWKPNETLVQTFAKNYSLTNLNEFFDEIDYPVAWEMRKDVVQYASDFRPPGVEVHCLHGYGVNTVNSLLYKKGKFPGGYPTFLFGDGDGTVNSRSLEGCLRWKDAQKETIYHQKFPDVDHMAVLRDPKIVNYITTLLNPKSRHKLLDLIDNYV